MNYKLLQISLSILLLMAVLPALPLKSQVAIGKDSEPDRNAVLELNSNSNLGLLLPRLELTSTSSFLPMKEHVKGMLVYNTVTAGVVPDNVSPGIYYNDGSRWILVITVLSGTAPIVVNEGNISLADGGIVTAKLADGSVTTAKIADNAVTIAKLPTGASPTNYLRGDGTWQTPNSPVILENFGTRQIISISRTASVNIRASGTGTLTYQWYSGKVGDKTAAISDDYSATTNGYCLPTNLTVDNNTYLYWCEVTDGNGNTAQSEQFVVWFTNFDTSGTCGKGGTPGALYYNGHTYLTHEYTYDNGATDCWMVSNSYEGIPSATYYGMSSSSDDVSRANGYYYTWSQAQSACPAGWHVPTRTEWNNLYNTINSSSTAANVKTWWLTSAGNAFAGYRNNIGTWYYWDSNGYWWTAYPVDHQYIYATMNSMIYSGIPVPNVLHSVRCVQNN